MFSSLGELKEYKRVGLSLVSIRRAIALALLEDEWTRSQLTANVGLAQFRSAYLVYHHQPPGINNSSWWSQALTLLPLAPFRTLPSSLFPLHLQPYGTSTTTTPQVFVRGHIYIHIIQFHIPHTQTGFFSIFQNEWALLYSIL